VCCSVLQCVVAFGNVLSKAYDEVETQCVAVRCSALQCVAAFGNVLSEVYSEVETE